MFHWGALERDTGLSDLEAWRGEGEWGVSTMNPSGIGEVTVTLFESPADALIYARERAYRSGEPYERDPERVPGAPPDPSSRGRVYYVFHTPVKGVSMDRVTPAFRALRGRRGKRHGERQSTEMVMVFVNAGRDKNNKTIWKLQAHNSITVEDKRAEDVRKAQPATERISRRDMGKDPRGQKQKRTRLGKPARTRGAASGARMPRPGEVMTRREIEQRARDARADQLRLDEERMEEQRATQRKLKGAALEREAKGIVGEKEHIESLIVAGNATPKQVARRDRIIERIDEIQDELREVQK